MKTSGTPFLELSPRDRILVTAHDLFYRDGVRATGVDRIIENSRVTKVTFYRQYPSKDELIQAYLKYRHEHWIGWFRAALEGEIAGGRSSGAALVATLEQWFRRGDFRGCAFLNAAAEFGSSDPEALAIVRQHKAEMTSVLEALMPRGAGRTAKARALALAVDGAILHAQMGLSVQAVLEAFKGLVHPMLLG